MNPALKILPLGDTTKYTRLIQNGTDSIKLKSGHVILQPGESVGEHSTGNKEEIIVIIRGRARVMVESHDPVEMEGPQMVYVPPNTKHNITNAGTGPLSYVFTVAQVL